jgi:hypothetical protein
MRFTTGTSITSVALALLPYFGAIADAQTIDQERLEAVHALLSQVQTTLETLPDAHKRILSSGAYNTLNLAHRWPRVQSSLAGAGTGEEAQSTRFIPNALTLEPNALTPADPLMSRINNPDNDFSYSTVSGFTQSETSTAWCGNNVVVGFNDSGSVWESFPIPNIGLSFSGASYSTDRGSSFHDVGFINPGTDINNFLTGDPVVNCVPAAGGGSPPIFYYTQIFSTGPASAPITAIAISKSTDGGATWQNPITAASKTAISHFLDKDWSAIDPTNPDRIFVTYTDFDISSTRCPAGVERTAIELVESVDAGITWAPPFVVTEACFNSASGFLSVQGSQVLFDSAGSANVAWESFAGANSANRALWISRSVDHGKTFFPAVKISNVTETGDGNNLQGGIRNNEFPMLAVDRSRGTLYVVWNDGRNFSVMDQEALDGRYRFADILLSRSANGGETWSQPVRVNQDPVSHLLNGKPFGTDHYQPGIAVDNGGRVGVCWYDRRNDPKNFSFGRFCSVSIDAGASWNLFSSVPGNWVPFHDMDFLIAQYYMGDYDNVASDQAGSNNGFVGAYAFVDTIPQLPNQDVTILKFP